ncbi:MAG: HIT domain-containing protein, partial [Sphaerochaetaceae bacterium]|nr:HIT domain-containing protein [Sphaerochaetaceae bacterium]
MPQDDTICLFCHIGKELILSENEFAYAIRDGFAVSEFHTLIIPKRHVSSYFELTDEELLACNR